MDYLRHKYLDRLEFFLNKLNNAISLIKDENLPEKDGEDLSSENEEYVIEYSSNLLTKYVLSVCNDDDLSESHTLENIEESVESQKLVEHDCNEVYSSRITLALRNLISSRMSLRYFDRISGSLMFNYSEEPQGHSPCGTPTVNIGDTGFVGFHSTGNPNTNCKLDENESDNLCIKLYPHDEVSLHDSDDVVYSKTEVSNLLKFRVCRLVLEFISDFPLDLSNRNGSINDHGSSTSTHRPSHGRYVAIMYRKHGQYILKRFCHLCVSVSPLKSERHLGYLKGHLSHSGPTKMVNLGFLDCSRPWIVYWSLHSLSLLGEDITPYKERAVQTLLMCWDNEHGGFGGGEFQRGHVATTYAAICVLKMYHSLHLIDNDKLYSFLMDMKLASGAFAATYGGESDTRSTYCAIASASMAGLLTGELTQSTPEFIQSCQTYEGGISAEPGLEAHAGYTYCGVACLAILGQLHRLDLNKLKYWAVRRVTSQFGFQGRPHKLVDSCYSFWIGAVLHIISTASSAGNSNDISTGDGGPDTMIQMLTRCYLLVVAQTANGFRDKPNKPPDLYHTCYSLSHLNIVSPIAKHRHDVMLNVLDMYFT